MGNPLGLRERNEKQNASLKREAFDVIIERYYCLLAFQDRNNKWSGITDQPHPTYLCLVELYTFGSEAKASFTLSSG